MKERCKYCGVEVKESNLARHMKNRCPKRPGQSSKQDDTPVSAKDIIVIISALLVLAGIIYLVAPSTRSLFIRVIDIHYKGAWMTYNWTNTKEFPPGKDLCLYPFCTKTNTKKHSYPVRIRGVNTQRDGGAYCPQHEPNSPKDDWIAHENFLIIFYYALVCILFALTHSAVVGLLLMILLLPWALLTNKKGNAGGEDSGDGDWMALILLAIIPITGIMFLFMYVWW